MAKWNFQINYVVAGFRLTLDSFGLLWSQNIKFPIISHGVHFQTLKKLRIPRSKGAAI